MTMREIHARIGLGRRCVESMVEYDQRQSIVSKTKRERERERERRPSRVEVLDVRECGDRFPKVHIQVF